MKGPSGMGQVVFLNCQQINSHKYVQYIATETSSMRTLKMAETMANMLAGERLILKKDTTNSY